MRKLGGDSIHRQYQFMTGTPRIKTSIGLHNTMIHALQNGVAPFYRTLWLFVAEQLSVDAAPVCPSARLPVFPSFRLSDCQTTFTITSFFFPLRNQR